MSFQGFAIAGPSAKMRRMAENCANPAGLVLCDSIKSGFDREIKKTDMAELWAISFFEMKAFSAAKISSIDSENVLKTISKKQGLTPV